MERHVVVADGVITALSNFARLPLPNLRPLAIGPCVQEVSVMICARSYPDRA